MATKRELDKMVRKYYSKQGWKLSKHSNCRIISITKDNDEKTVEILEGSQPRSIADIEKRLKKAHSK